MMRGGSVNSRHPQPGGDGVHFNCTGCGQSSGGNKGFPRALGNILASLGGPQASLRPPSGIPRTPTCKFWCHP